MSEKHKHNLVVVISYFEDSEEESLKSISFVVESGVSWEEALDSALRYMQRSPGVRLDHYESIMAYLTHASAENYGINDKVVFIEKRCG